MIKQFVKENFRSLVSFIKEILKGFDFSLIVAIIFEIISSLLLFKSQEYLSNFTAEFSNIGSLTIFTFLWVSSELIGGIAETLTANSLPKLENSIRLMLFDYLLKMDTNNLNMIGPTKIDENIDIIARNIIFITKSFIESILPTTIIVFFFLSKFFAVKIKVGLLASTTMLCYMCLFIPFARYLNRTFTKSVEKLNQERTHFSVNFIRNLALLKVFDSYEFARSKLKAIMESSEKVNIKGLIYDAIGFTVLAIVFFVLQTTFILRPIADMVTAKKLSISNAILLRSATFWLLWSIIDISNELSNMLSNIAAIINSLEFFYLNPEEENKIEGIVLENFKGLIEFKDFSFAYGKKVIFNEFNLTIPVGAMVVIVGLSGAGKSTLLQLFLQLGEIPKGVYIDGVELNDLNKKSFRSSLCYVPQSNSLMEASIEDNLRIGSPNATEEDLINATKKTYSYNFIQSLPNKFQTILGVNQRGISGGQAQRINIARSLIHILDKKNINKKYLYLYDEPLTGLDTETARKLIGTILEITNNINNPILEDNSTNNLSLNNEDLHKSLNDLIDNTTNKNTTLIVDHSFLVAPYADFVLWFNGDGNIKVGTHKELMEFEDYKSLVNQQ